MMNGMNPCARCGTITPLGQFYRFDYGVVVDDPDVGPGPTFRPAGSEEVYFCDRCLVEAAAWEEKLRTGFFLAPGLFGVVVAGVLFLASSRGLWACLLVLLLIAVLFSAAYRRYRDLQAALRSEYPALLREAVGSDPKIQNMGDEWAIAHRRQALQGPGAEVFLTRDEKVFWSESPPARP